MKNKNVKLNYIYNVFYQILASILPLITSPYIARTIGAEGLGIYSYAYSIAHYFAIFILLGLSNYGNREIASVREDKEKLSRTFWEIYFMQASIAIIIIIAYTSYLMIFQPSDFLVGALMMFYIVSVAFDINWFFYGMELFKYTVIRNSIIKVLTVILIFIFVKGPDDTWKYTLIMVAGFLISQLALWPYLRKYVWFRLPKINAIFKHLKPNIVLFIPVVAINIYKYMDKIMLGALINKTQVGYYENAEKVILIPMGFITAFGNVMLPKMSNLYASGKQSEGNSYIDTSFRFITALTLAMAFGLASVATKFSILFWGESFEVCGSIISVLAISMIFISWPNVIRTQYLIPTHQEKHYIISVVIGAVVNFIVNYMLIYKYEAIGTAIGTVFAELSVCIYQCWVVRKPLKIAKVLRTNLPYLIPGTVMFLIVSYISSTQKIGIIQLLTEICIGGVIYVSIVALDEIIFKRQFFVKYVRKYLKLK
ncbi:MAG: flippase [Clostridiaceae bacterium]|nr:flippase [Clostridiaceae bacterium]